MKKTLVSLLGGLSMLACEFPKNIPIYRTGTVVKESYIQPVVEESRVQSLTGGGETVKIGKSKYILTVNADDKKTYVISIDDHYSHGPKESLDQIIDVGTKIKFDIGFKKYPDSDGYFPDFQNGFGDKYVGEIEVLQ